MANGIDDLYKEYLKNKLATVPSMGVGASPPVEQEEIVSPVQAPIQKPTPAPIQQVKQEPIATPPVEDIPTQEAIPVKQENNDLQSLISDYKKALSESEKSMQIDKDQLKSAQWMDAANNIARTLNSVSGKNIPAPDQSNYAGQYLNQAAAERAGATAGLDSRAKLLNLYRRLSNSQAPKDPSNDYYKDMNLQLRQRELMNREEDNKFRKEARIDERKEKDIQKVSEKLGDTQELMSAMDNVESKLGFTLDQANVKNGSLYVKGEKKDLPGISIPGLGRVTAYDDQAKMLNDSMANVFNTRIKSRSGAAVSSQEMERLKEEFSTGKFNTESQMIQALKDYKIAVGKALKNKEAGFKSDVLDTYKERGGVTSDKFISPNNQESNSKLQDQVKEINGKKYKKVQGGWEAI